MDISGNIKYGLTDRPPLFNWFILSIQQVSILASYFAVVILVYRAGGYPESLIAHVLSIAMFALAISSILQAIWKGPIGSGFFAMPVNSAIYLIPSVLVIQQAGIPGLIAMTVFAGVIELLLSFVIKYVHFIFSPAVVGSMIALIGFELCVVGFQLMFSINVPLEVPKYLTMHAIVSAIALIVMIVSTIWARGFIRLIPVFLGIILGSLLSWPTHLISMTAVHSLASAPAFELPVPHIFGFSIQFHLMLAFFFAAIAAAMRSMGSIITCQTMNDPNWTHTDFTSIRKGLTADGIGCIIAGLMSVPGITLGPSPVSVSQYTGATSRWISFSTAILLVILSLFPVISSLFLLIPVAIIGTTLVFNGAYMMAQGIKLLIATELDARNTLLFGVSFTLGGTFVATPTFFQHLPYVMTIFTSSALSMAGFVIVIMTLIFKLGNTAKVKLDTEGDIGSIKDFNKKLMEQLKGFGLSCGRLQQVGMASGSLLKKLAKLDIDLTTLNVEALYDKEKLKLVYSYEGRLVEYRGSARKFKKYLLEEDVFVVGLRQLFSGAYVDQVKTEKKDDTSSITLSFITR